MSRLFAACCRTFSASGSRLSSDSSAFGCIWLLVSMGILAFSKRLFCLLRAAATRFLIDSLCVISGVALWWSSSSSCGTWGTSIQISIRSRMGPEIFFLYFCNWSGEQVQGLEEPKFPQGHGFIAATNTKRAGKLVEPLMRDM